MENFQKEIFEQMNMMGFEQKEIERSWQGSQIKTVEGLINWIEQNPSQQNVSQNYQQEQVQNQSQQNVTNQTQNFFQENSEQISQKPKQNKNVDKIVKKEIVTELQLLGFSQIASEKAALFSGNKTADEALKWIEEHKNEKDFEDPIEVEAKPQLTDEEARAEAIKLQKKIREEALKFDKEKELESEKLRLKMGKEISDAKRIMKEQELKIQIEAQTKEKQKYNKEKDDMMKILEEDKKRKFGDKYKPSEHKAKSKHEEFEELYDKMYKIYRMGQTKELITCYKTLAIYTKNLIGDPNNPKFRSINGNNENFQKRVRDIIGGEQILKILGFELQTNGFYEMKNLNLQELTAIFDLLNQKCENLAKLQINLIQFWKCLIFVGKNFWFFKLFNLLKVH